MIKKTITTAVLLLTVSFYSLYAQANLYEIKYNGIETGSTEFFKLIDSCYNRFNEVFHFPPTGPGYKYQVSLFADVEAYKAYVTEKTNAAAPKSQTVFLRYPASSKSEVVAVIHPDNKNTFIRQLFTQYIYSFLASPPAWLTSGFSLYFEQFDENTEAPWLESAKALYLNESSRITPALMLEATKDTYAADIFLPQTWLFVSFLMESPYHRNARFLFESLNSAITDAYSDADPFTEYYTKWMNSAQFERDYDEYVNSLHSVKEDLSRGIQAYSEKNIDTAKELFLSVLASQSDNYTAAYYLALCAYTQKNYKEADEWYKKSLLYGADPALVNWGLGASAYADRRYEEGKTYLLKAKQLDEATYGKRVDDLIQQMP